MDNPSNPWIAVGWCKRDDITVPLADVLARQKIDFTSSGARKVHPQENRIELKDGLSVGELDEDGKKRRTHALPFAYGMMLPAFTGVEALRDVERLTNPRGFVLIDKQQRNPKYRNIYSVGVCVAIPPLEATPVPTGVPKTGYMIESMAIAATRLGPHGTPFVSRIWATPVLRSCRFRRCRRATSTG